MLALVSVVVLGSFVGLIRCPARSASVRGEEEDERSCKAKHKVFQFRVCSKEQYYMGTYPILIDAGAEKRPSESMSF